MTASVPIAQKNPLPVSIFFIPPIRHLSTWIISLSAFSSLEDEQSHLSQPLLVSKMLQLLNHLCGPSLDCPGRSCLSCTEEPWTGHSTPGADERAKMTFLDLLAMNFLMQGTVGLLCWLIVSLLSTKTLKPFSEELLSSQLVTTVYWCLGLFIPWRSTLLSSVRFLSACFSSLSRSLWMEA